MKPNTPGIALLMLIVTISCCALSGCLTAEHKEYIFRVNPDGSGSGAILFYNIMTADEEGKDATLKDYAELINKYYKGTSIETDHPEYLNVKKRLYDSNGCLNGEISFEFKRAEEVGLYRFQGKGNWMYSTAHFSGLSSERLDTLKTNGAYGGEIMPVVFWPEGATQFRIVTNLDKPDGKTRSLLSNYKKTGVIQK